MKNDDEESTLILAIFGLDIGVNFNELVSKYVRPNERSVFKSSPLEECVYDAERKNFKTVLDDEFPLGKFHLLLRKKIMEVKS